MGLWQTVSRLLSAPEDDVSAAVKERSAFARTLAAEKMEEDAQRLEEDAVEGPCGDELREQARKMREEARWLRDGPRVFMRGMGFEREGE